MFISSNILPITYGLFFRHVQSVSVQGYLKCNDKPATDITVKLYDKDTFTFDDLMAKGKTDSNGYFKLSGSEKEMTKIDPELVIHNSCGSKLGKFSMKRIKVTIPKSYITNGPIPSKVFDIGTMELAGKIKT
ncbi:Transthyretin-like family and Immunoglobulin-like fold domain-containing protein [Strongyloides ratti]|uniref:Transthyretin-like family and Immunoglobulin-like fold domain-containing protein n=1 Tax=Strongyloides ratti TaxID=34506 RepID=A0A090LH39_STRRB|nr:Transthyretin-like family and Immunoglobulin-like fold domain-containing protein [Strongyloides ratti]CEF69111.1 Transthyretin-like family and Immunoglobulin-like fold domain-containing protein [Strongyloides ratti]